MRRLTFGALRALLVFAALLALGATSAAAAPVTVHAGTSPSGALSFRPAQIHADEGERVTLTLVNDDADTPHDWALLEYGGRDIEVYVRGGQTRTINFTATEVGSYRIVCQVVGHKQQGMEGELVVAEKLLVPAAAAPFALVSMAAAGIALGRRRA